VSAATKPTRREERRIQTVLEIKQLAMEQISTGGPEAVSLSGIVREMSMSPAAVYRYFANRDALLADLVVDAYDELADSLGDIPQSGGSAGSRLDEVLRATRAWALEHPNAYRLIFQTSIGSGEELAPERTVPAATRSMSAIISALVAVTMENDIVAANTPPVSHLSLEVLILAFLTWTRLHGIISLELGGHLAATGVGADALFDAEVRTIRSEAAGLPPAMQD
jgi:AcrR family transcriptional regulator